VLRNPTRRPAQSDGEGSGIPPELAVLPPEEQAAWLEENGPDLPPEQLETIRAWLAMGNGPSDAMEAVQNLVNSEGRGVEGEDVEAHESNEATQPTLEEFVADWEQRYPGADVQRADLIDIARAQGAADPEATVDAFIEERGAENEESDDEGDEEGDTETPGFTDLNLPEWVLQTALQLNQGVPLTEVQMGRIVDYWNLYHGDASNQFSSIEEIAPYLNDPSRANQILIEAAVLDDLPEQAITINVPNGSRVTIPQSLATNLFENYGFDMNSLPRMARLVAMTGKDMLPFEDPADNLLIAAGLMSGLGLQDELSVEARERQDEMRRQQAIVDAREARGQGGRRPGTGFFFGEEEGAGDTETDRAKPGMRTQYGTENVNAFLDAALSKGQGHDDHAVGWVRQNWRQLSDEDRRAVNNWLFNHPGVRAQVQDLPGVQRDASARRGGPQGPAASTVSLGLAQHRFRAGMERYQDVGLAMVYAIDPGLAGRVAATGGDPSRLSPDDELKVWSVIRRTTGQQAESWLDMAPDSPLSLFRSLSSDRLGGGGGAGGAGRIRRMIDPVQAKQQFADLFGALLLNEPPDELKDQLVGWLQGELDAAEEGMNFDASARIREFVENNPRFKELYANRPAGMNPEEYLAMFQTGAASMLGAEAPSNASLEAGLKTGQYQTTIGATLSEQLGKPEELKNSRMFGRLAEVADIFGGAT
jgi:hypothetical protein